uniref:FLYWCH-type domain-containing protein n=1 Tax=Phlebotomus papatasi TaxID=29031 RepID=A0A1B0GN86_PHLPP
MVAGLRKRIQESIIEHEDESNVTMSFRQTSMGRPCLELNGFTFLYNKSVESTGTTYWRCSFSSARKKNPCDVRCITRHGILQKRSGSHNHPPLIKTGPLSFIKTPWSTSCLVIDNYIYNCHSNTHKGKSYWRCHNYSKRNVDERCRARCVIKDGKIQALTGGHHNHLPHTEKIQKIRKRESLMDKCDSFI